MVAPAFSEVSPEHPSFTNPEYHYQDNNKLVWDETIRIIMDMFDNVWGDSSEIVVDHCLDITLPVRFSWFRSHQSQLPHQIALFVISVAGILCPVPKCVIAS
jgi:hypothetical protein